MPPPATHTPPTIDIIMTDRPLSMDFAAELAVRVAETSFSFAPVDRQSPLGLIVAISGVGPGAVATSLEQAHRYKRAVLDMALANDLNIVCSPTATLSPAAHAYPSDVLPIPARLLAELAQQVPIQSPPVPASATADDDDSDSGPSDPDASGSEEELHSISDGSASDGSQPLPNGYHHPSDPDSQSSSNSADSPSGSGKSSSSESSDSRSSSDASQADDAGGPSGASGPTGGPPNPPSESDTGGGAHGGQPSTSYSRAHHTDHTDGDGPEAKRPRLRGATGHDQPADMVADLRCRRCTFFGQICVHSTVGQDGLLPAPCAGCISSNDNCSFVDVVPNLDIVPSTPNPARRHIFLGLNDPLTRAVFLELLDDLANRDIIDDNIRRQSVQLYEELAEKAVLDTPLLFIDATGRLGVAGCHT